MPNLASLELPVYVTTVADLDAAIYSLNQYLPGTTVELPASRHTVIASAQQPTIAGTGLDQNDLAAIQAGGLIVVAAAGKLNIAGNR